MKRYLFLLVAVAVLMLSFVAVQSPARAATTSNTGTVIASKLRVRDAGSLQGKLIELVKRGDILTVLGRNSRMSWLKVQAPDGKTGWVSMLWIKLPKTTLLKNLPVVS